MSGSVSVTPPADHGAIRMGTPPVTASGSFSTSNPGGSVDQVHVHLDWTGPATRPGLPSDKDVCANGKPPCGTANVPYSTALTPVDNNGPYHVTVTGTGHDLFNQNLSVSVAADFVLAIPPATPANLKATLNKDRSVTLVWDRNSEADMYVYEVARKGPSDKAFKPIVRLFQTIKATDKPAFTDNQLPAQAGTYQWQVTAMRNGESGDSTTLIASPPAGPVSQRLSAAPPGSTTPTTRPSPSGLSFGPPTLKFSGGTPPKLSSAQPSTTPTTEQAVPDPGFVRGLPYGNRPGSGEDSGDNPAVELHRKGGGGPGSAVLIPAAFGSILFVGAFQLRWLMKVLETPPV